MTQLNYYSKLYVLQSCETVKVRKFLQRYQERTRKGSSQKHHLNSTNQTTKQMVVSVCTHLPQPLNRTNQTTKRMVVSVCSHLPQPLNRTNQTTKQMVVSVCTHLPQPLKMVLYSHPSTQR